MAEVVDLIEDKDVVAYEVSPKFRVEYTSSQHIYIYHNLTGLCEEEIDLTGRPAPTSMAIDHLEDKLLIAQEGTLLCYQKDAIIGWNQLRNVRRLDTTGVHLISALSNEVVLYKSEYTGTRGRHDTIMSFHDITTYNAPYEYVVDGAIEMCRMLDNHTMFIASKTEQGARKIVKLKIDYFTGQLEESAHVPPIDLQPFRDYTLLDCSRHSLVFRKQDIVRIVSYEWSDWLDCGEERQDVSIKRSEPIGDGVFIDNCLVTFAADVAKLTFKRWQHTAVLNRGRSSRSLRFIGENARIRNLKFDQSEHIFGIKENDRGERTLFKMEVLERWTKDSLGDCSVDYWERDLIFQGLGFWG